jgi:hypothetical protein
MAIFKIAFVKYNRLENDVSSTSSGMDEIDSHEVVRGLSVG